MVEYRDIAPKYALGGGGTARNNLTDLKYSEILYLHDHKSTLHTTGVTGHRLPFGSESSRKAPV